MKSISLKGKRELADAVSSCVHAVCTAVYSLMLSQD
jgi:hypothetical protein